jgi:hypothetical protein
VWLHVAAGFNLEFEQPELVSLELRLVKLTDSAVIVNIICTSTTTLCCHSSSGSSTERAGGLSSDGVCAVWDGTRQCLIMAFTTIGEILHASRRKAGSVLGGRGLRMCTIYLRWRHWALLRYS